MSAVRLLARSLALALAAGCSCSSSGAPDGGELADVAVTDAGVDADTGVDDAGTADDAGSDVDAGPRVLRLVGGGFGSAPLEGGTMRVVDHGFLGAETTCAGALCASGGFTTTR